MTKNLRYQLIHDGDVMLSTPKDRDGLKSCYALAEQSLKSPFPPEFQMEIHLWDREAESLREVVHQWIEFDTSAQFDSFDDEDWERYTA